MKQTEPEKNQSERINDDLVDSGLIKDYEEIINNNKLNLLGSADPNAIIKSLSKPRFLGSYHLKEDINPNFKPLNNLIKGELDYRYTKSLKSTIFNPITIILIVVFLIFNILWFLLPFF